MLKKLVLGAGLALAIFAASATGALALDDKKFVSMAVRGNMGEIAIGELAATKGSTDAVRSFGTKLKTDHTAANEKALALASSMHIRTPKRLPKQFQKQVDKLQKLSGPEFDSAFWSYNLRVHRRQVRLFTEQAKSSNAQVAAFATATLPTLQDHLKMAQSMARKDGQNARGRKAGKAPDAATSAVPSAPTAADPNATGDGSSDSDQM